MSEPTYTTYKYLRVTRDLPCQICGKDGWCLISRFGDRAACCRVKSSQPAPQFDGWFHDLRPGQRHLPAVIAQKARTACAHATKDFTDMMAGYVADFDRSSRARAADVLGLSPDVFDKYYVGFKKDSHALVFPSMQLRTPLFIGIRYRSIIPGATLKWWTERGTTACPMLPLQAPVEGEPIVVSEGPSDALAAASIGMHAIARWSCFLDERQSETVRDHLSQLNAPTVIVVGDNDERGTGHRGADSAAVSILKYSPHAVVRRVQPPDGVKDLRAWVHQGATAKDVISAAREVAHAI